MSQNDTIKRLDDIVSTMQRGEEKKGGKGLRQQLSTMNKVMKFNHSEVQLEQLARDIEEREGITIGTSAIVSAQKSNHWWTKEKERYLEERRENSALKSPYYYWDRYNTYLQNKNFPISVINELDNVTDRIMDQLNDPRDLNQEGWKQRGMVVGYVQSGKTSNFIGLINKAADAGYKMIIVIAGTTNSLREQTQRRIDDGFVGFPSKGYYEGKILEKSKGIGVGELNSDKGKCPVQLTSVERDFKKSISETIRGILSKGIEVPLVCVIKKNIHTLKNLYEWLTQDRYEDGQVRAPMLLIDDEADSASINTKANNAETDPTKINEGIRRILSLFKYNAYIGYTATPFANIFIDPEDSHSFVGEDLFPKDFIIGLKAPTNYFGLEKIFFDGYKNKEDYPDYVRYIDDNEGIIPVRHKSHDHLEEIPESLKKAICAFFLARTIRNLRGQEEQHCSMLIHPSRFTNLHGEMKFQVEKYVRYLLENLENNEFNHHILDIFENIFNQEYKNYHLTKEEDKVTWQEVKESLYESATQRLKICEVNVNSEGDPLGYNDGGRLGKTIIAIGGNSLSRGLTLEGLTITWFLRNSRMYDTLMQMGRWFGYRPHYEDLCRIWMTETVAEWFHEIAEATEELFGELETMQKEGKNPMQFGLAVRQNPESLLMVTARNKSGAAEITRKVGLAKRWVDTNRFSTKQEDLQSNIQDVKRFLAKIGAASREINREYHGFFKSGVPVKFILGFLEDWKGYDYSFVEDPKFIARYIHKHEHDLRSWDLLVVSPERNNFTEDFSNGWLVGQQIRKVNNWSDLNRNFVAFKATTQDIEKAGLTEADIEDAEANYREKKKKTPSRYPNWTYRSYRKRPLLVIYTIKLRPPKDSEKKDCLKKIERNWTPSYFDKLLDTPIVGWGIGFPASNNPEDDGIDYMINKVKQKQIQEEFAEGGEESDDG